MSDDCYVCHHDFQCDEIRTFYVLVPKTLNSASVSFTLCRVCASNNFLQNVFYKKLQNDKNLARCLQKYSTRSLKKHLKNI